MRQVTPAYITGMGIITAIGNNLAENLNSLLAEKDGIKSPKHLNTIHNFPIGEVPYSNEELAQMAGAIATYPRTALLSIIAAKEATKAIADKLANYRVGLVSAYTVGGMDLVETIFDKIPKHEAVDVRKVWYHEAGAITELTASYLNIKDCWNTTLSTACSSSANTLMLGTKLIEQGKMDIVIAGGADSLSKFTLNGFNSLMILDKELCQPFDENRRGLNLGEGAAYVVLMNDKIAEELGLEKMARISGYSNANDAFHQTASSPDGIGNKIAISNALKQAQLKPNEIDYINLHGTGTSNNDAAEGAAIEQIFEGYTIPEASSTKCYTGHTLGAAGVIETVYSVLAIQEQKAWAHLRLKTKIQDQSFSPNTTIVSKSIKNVLTNSFGFGGNCSALVISKVEN